MPARRRLGSRESDETGARRRRGGRGGGAPRIGWVTGEGLGANIAKVCPRWLTLVLVGLLVVANTINIAADIGAMGEGVRLLAGGHAIPYVIGFGVLSIVCQVTFSYERTVRVLKWLTLGLFAYVAVILSVSVPWRQVAIEGRWRHRGARRRADDGLSDRRPCIFELGPAHVARPASGR